MKNNRLYITRQINGHLVNVRNPDYLYDRSYWREHGLVTLFWIIGIIGALLVITHRDTYFQRRVSDHDTQEPTRGEFRGLEY